MKQLVADRRPVLPEVSVQLPGGHAVNTRRAIVAHNRAQRGLGVPAADHLFHHFLMHRVLSGVTHRALLFTADLRLPRLHRLCFGRPSRVVTAVVAPAGFRPLARGPTAPPLALLRISSALRFARLSPDFFATTASADSSCALTREVSPGKVLPLSPRAAQLYHPRFFDGLWTSPSLAGSSPAAGLAAGSCSCGRGFVSRFFRPRLAVAPCVRLRLPPSAPSDSFHPDRFSPCRAH